MDKDILIPIICVVAVFAILLGGLFFLDSRYCYAKTADMGFDSRWTILGECQIEVNPNQWIPLESYYFKQE